MNTKEPLTRYNIKLPHELGKVVYVQSFDIKKRIRSELGVRIAQLLFCGFGFAISLVMLYSGWQKEDVWHGLIGALFFPFFFMIVLLLKDLLRTTLIVVCDKGIARFTLSYALKICQSEFFYFKDATHCTQEEGFVDPHSPVSKKGYRFTTTWFNETRKCFSISYLRENEIEGFHPDKEAAKIGREAYRLFCARSHA
ncbi:hypothetical protein [Sulfurospirillum oryzae]|uniref:hypothetical protein n=1 Tax=Sulfurospirillum oryzae TaxID=2976535 RepID=UPI0021E8CC1D|nr:hypothetical protein [Sulfurospirillum oryzae]